MTVNEALNIKDAKRTQLLNEADDRRRELHMRLREIALIDKKIELSFSRIMAGESVDVVSADTEKLNEERARILASAGYESDYDEPKFECSYCKDSGYVGGLKLCQCVKSMVANSKFAKSRLASGLVDKTFENFDLGYYSQQNGERTQMEVILNGCKRYVKAFPDNSSAGLLFVGNTGLGKTHLSAAIANEIANRGFSVVYESAQQIYDTCDAVRFNRMDISEKAKYENCSLLIIDDLGAECITQFSVSSMVSLIDLRIVKGKQTIISSNLSPANIQKLYGERLYSRLVGEFNTLQFVGKDIRMQKIKG